MNQPIPMVDPAGGPSAWAARLALLECPVQGERGWRCYRKAASAGATIVFHRGLNQAVEQRGRLLRS